MNFRIDRWSAIAPGLTSHDDWVHWLSTPNQLGVELDPVSLKQFPSLIRRRFGALGKCAMGAVLPLIGGDECLPCVFASRHGNSALTLELLSGIAEADDMSPTGFSLAVHNAISGLFTIARKDTSPVTSIAATEGLVIHALIEAVGQLETSPAVLCVIYDLPLPDLVKEYETIHFPYAVAMVLSRSDDGLCLSSSSALKAGEGANEELNGLMRFLTGMQYFYETSVNGLSWVIQHKDVNQC